MELIKLIEEVDKYPLMFLPQRTISSLKAFLDGWLLGKSNTSFIVVPLSNWDWDWNEVKESKPIDPNYAIMRKFQNHVQQVYEVETTHSWASIILFHSSDEFEALTTFFKEFRNFLSKHYPTY